MHEIKFNTKKLMSSFILIISNLKPETTSAIKQLAYSVRGNHPSLLSCTQYEWEKVPVANYQTFFHWSFQMSYSVINWLLSSFLILLKFRVVSHLIEKLSKSDQASTCDTPPRQYTLIHLSMKHFYRKICHPPLTVLVFQKSCLHHCQYLRTSQLVK